MIPEPPPNVDILEWVNFAWTSVILVTPVVIAFTYGLYRGIICRFSKLRQPSDVLRLRRTWIWTLLLAIGLQALLASMVGISVISEKRLDVLLAVITHALRTTLLSGVAYWLVSVWLLPKRVKYIAPLSVWLNRR